MNSTDPMPGTLSIAGLPDEIFLCYQLHPPIEDHVDVASLHNQSGSDLTERMIRHFMQASEIEVITQKNEKPSGVADGKEVSVSFSHTDTAVVSAISSKWTVGCDMESASRNVHPRLIERMKHPEEEPALYENLEAVRIWTFKEASLKMIGTGLRKPMHSVHIEQVDNRRFDVEIDNGNRAKICSFEHKGHWISVCYK